MDKAKLPNYEEHYALACRIPEELSLKSYFAEHALEEVQTAKVSEDRKREITSAARGLLRNIEELRGHIERREIGQAVMVAMDVGFWPERIVRLYFQRDVEQNNKRIRSKDASVETERANADKRMVNGLKAYDALPPMKQLVAAKRIGVSVRTLSKWLNQRKCGNG